MTEPPDVPGIVARMIDRIVAGTIDLPRITIVPSSDVTIGFDDFDMDLAGIHLPPVSQDILIQYLRTHDRERLTSAGDPVPEERLEDYLIRGLIDRDDIDYDAHADLLYKLAGQVVAHLRSYLTEESALHNVLQHHQRTLVDLIHAQMRAHCWERATSYEPKVSRGFEIPRTLAFETIWGEPARDFRAPVEPLSDVPRLVFAGFARCLYPEQKFSSDPERRFAILLEDEPAGSELKWFKPARNQFKIYYRGGEGYEPDFVVETATAKYLCEPKRRDAMNDPVVIEKARAATAWCRHATAHELAHGGKPWTYLLIPHDAIGPSATLAGLAASYAFKDETIPRADFREMAPSDSTITKEFAITTQRGRLPSN